MDQRVIRFLTKIGQKGGLAGKGSPRRIKANRRMTQNRLFFQHPIPKEISPEDEINLDLIERSG